MDLPRVVVAPTGAARGRAVILHGNGLCAAFYRPLMERLAERGLASTALDLPGFAAPRAEPLGVSGLLDAVRPAVREGLGEGGILVGHSLGGLVSLLLAPDVPARSLVLMEPAIAGSALAARLAAAIYVRTVVDGYPGFRNRGPGFWRLHDPSRVHARWVLLSERTAARGDRAAIAALHADLPGLYPLPFDAVRVPVVCVRGGSSGLLMAAAQRSLVWRFADARAVTIPEAGHWMANEQDESLAEVIAGSLP